MSALSGREGGVKIGGLLGRLGLLRRGGHCEKSEGEKRERMAGAGGHEWVPQRAALKGGAAGVILIPLLDESLGRRGFVCGKNRR
jgi:hypothetical protein